MNLNEREIKLGVTIRNELKNEMLSSRANWGNVTPELQLIVDFLTLKIVKLLIRIESLEEQIEKNKSV